MPRKFSSKRPLTDAEEAEIQRMIASDPDNPELTDEQIAALQPFAEVFPALAESIKRGPGRPKLDQTLEAVTLRLDSQPSSISALRALTGASAWRGSWRRRRLNQPASFDSVWATKRNERSWPARIRWHVSGPTTLRRAIVASPADFRRRCRRRNRTPYVCPRRTLSLRPKAARLALLVSPLRRAGPLR